MRVLDAGHRYALRHLDGDGEETLQFVKREGEGYPGNIGHCEGTTCQEVFRVCLDRLRYVNAQIPSEYTADAMSHVREALYSLELRAAGRHHRVVNFNRDDVVSGPTCGKCGHIGCEGQCHTRTTPTAPAETSVEDSEEARLKAYQWMDENIPRDEYWEARKNRLAQLFSSALNRRALEEAEWWDRFRQTLWGVTRKESLQAMDDFSREASKRIRALAERSQQEGR